MSRLNYPGRSFTISFCAARTTEDESCVVTSTCDDIRRVRMTGVKQGCAKHEAGDSMLMMSDEVVYGPRMEQSVTYKTGKHKSTETLHGL